MNSKVRDNFLKSSLSASENFVMFRWSALIPNSAALGIPEITADHLGTIYRPLNLLQFKELAYV